MDSRGQVVLDGTPCGGAAMRRGYLGQGDTADLSTISRGTTERDFIFSNLQLTGMSTGFSTFRLSIIAQDDEALLGCSVSKNFGEILLDITHGTITSSWLDMAELPKLDHSDKRHEKMVKKLSSHCVG